MFNSGTSSSRVAAGLVVISLIAAVGPRFVVTHAQEALAIYRWTTAGGGQTSSGGALTVVATVGQAEAGHMRGGELTLIGGFWPLYLPTASPTATASPSVTASATATASATDTDTPTAPATGTSPVVTPTATVATTGEPPTEPVATSVTPTEPGPDLTPSPSATDGAASWLYLPWCDNRAVDD
jgi:hypothetical protein